MNDGIILEKVNFSYNRGHSALINISCKIIKGAFVGITGLNGSGKTTLLYLLNGIIPHLIQGRLSGEVMVDSVSTKDKSVSFFAKKVGVLFQNPDFSLFNLSVEEEIAFGLKNLKLNQHQQRIKQALTTVGLKGFEKRDPQTLSFGEKQRVNLACLLAIEPEYLVLDEPSSMLDYKSAKQLYDTLRNLNQKGKTVIVVEHDTDLLKEYTQEIIILHQGKIVSSGLTERVFSDHKLLTATGIRIPK